MNEFVSWCRHLLVSFLFHAMTSLHPPSFHRNDFSTCISALLIIEGCLWVATHTQLMSRCPCYDWGNLAYATQPQNGCRAGKPYRSRWV